MTDSKSPTDSQFTRRKAISVALAGGGALLVAGTGSALYADTTKASQKSVAYRPKPSGAARCDNCTQWQAPAACKLVAGTISPAGWCSIYSPKH